MMSALLWPYSLRLRPLWLHPLEVVDVVRVPGAEQSMISTERQQTSTSSPSSHAKNIVKPSKVLLIHRSSQTIDGDALLVEDGNCPATTPAAQFSLAPSPSARCAGLALSPLIGLFPLMIRSSPTTIYGAEVRLEPSLVYRVGKDGFRHWAAADVAWRNERAKG